MVSQNESLSSEIDKLTVILNKLKDDVKALNDKQAKKEKPENQ